MKPVCPDMGGLFQSAYEDYLRLKSAAFTEAPEEAWCRVYGLFEEIQLKNKTTGTTWWRRPLRAFAHLILAVLSIITLWRCSYRKLDTAHYLIDINNNSSNVYDVRSGYILDNLYPDTTVNFFHCSQLSYALRTLGKRHNPVYFESLWYWRRWLPGWKAKPLKWAGNDRTKTDNDKAGNAFKNHVAMVPEITNRVAFCQRLIRRLRLRRFVFLDDSRHTNELHLACQREKVQTLAYMHARFNQYHVGLEHFTFDKYLLWSGYFRDSLKRLNPSYQDKQMHVCGHPKWRLRKCEALKPDRECTVLVVGESNVSIEELEPYWVKLDKMDGWRVIFRGKPGTSLGKYVSERHPGWEQDHRGTFFDTMQRHSVTVVLGTHSTALMECWLQGVPAVMISSSYDYAWHLVDEGFIPGCVNPDRLAETLEQARSMSSTEIYKTRAELWGDSPDFNFDALKNWLTKEG